MLEAVVKEAILLKTVVLQGRMEFGISEIISEVSLSQSYAEP